MAINKKIESIKTSWEGYTGGRVEEFIKDQLSSKVGFILNQEREGKVYFFASEEDSENMDKKIGEVTFAAPYAIELKIDDTNNYTFLSSSENKKIIWYFKTISTSNNNIYQENISVEYKFQNLSEGRTTYHSSNISVKSEDNYSGYTKVELNLDDFVTNGATNIEINVRGSITKQTNKLDFSVKILSLDVTDNTNFASPVTDYFKTNLYVNCTNQQEYFYEYRIFRDGEFDNAIEWKTSAETKKGTGSRQNVSFNNYYGDENNSFPDGKYILEYRLGINLQANLATYYTNIHRLEFIKDTEGKITSPEILIYTNYKNNVNLEDIYKNGNLIINGISQYISYKLKYSVYNRNGSTNLEFYEEKDGNEKFLDIKTVSNGEIYTYEIQSNDFGEKLLKIKPFIKSDNNEDNIYWDPREIYLNIQESNLNISICNRDLRIDFSSVGRTNEPDNRERWESIIKDGDRIIHTTNASFDNFDWSQGWTSNGLVVSQGSKLNFDYAPFSEGEDKIDSIDKGFTFEIEFMTQNVINESTIVCDMKSEDCGLQITGSEIKFIIPSGKKSVSTRFKSDELNRVAIVIRPQNNVSGNFKGLVELYVNGVLSNIAPYEQGDKFVVNTKNDMGNNVPKNLSFNGAVGADIVIKYLRTYKTALSSDEIVNNYILCRSNPSEMLNLYNKNNILNESDVITPESVIELGNVPVLVFVGRTNENIPSADGNDNSGEDYRQGDISYKTTDYYETLENTSDKKLAVNMDVIYYNPLDTSKNFKFIKAYITPQGTSSMYYPKKNYRIYTQKNTDTRCFFSNDKAGVLDFESMMRYDFGESFEDRQWEKWRGKNNSKERKYAFKDNSQPVKCWCLKADFAETSSSHNTGIARLWGDTLKNSKVTRGGSDIPVFKTNAQKKIEEKHINNKKEMPDVRTTIDGFPIVVFGKKSYDEPAVFLGKYNFNNDKSTESVFGFCDIDNTHKYGDISFDYSNGDSGYTGSTYEHTLDDMLNQYMTCIETLDNGNNFANFSVMEEVNKDGKKITWDDAWDKAFEFRYPEIPEEPKASDYKKFVDGNEVWLPKDENGKGGEEKYNEAVEAYKNDELIPWQNKHLKPFKHFAEWIYSTRWCDVNGAILTDELEKILEGNENLVDESGNTISTVEELANFRQRKFAKEKWDHLDVWKMAAYYIYAMRFGAVDQIVKNSMLTSEGPFAYDKDGVPYGVWDSTPLDNELYGRFYKWYYINYDNDTIMGVKNDGSLAYGPEITRKSEEGSGDTISYIYAGSNSTLWNNFDTDEEFQEIVRIADQGISKTMTYSNAINMFDVEQVSKWGERIYNRDADYKYISPYVADWKYSGETVEGMDVFVDKLFMLQGSRTAHRHWWLSKRFNLFDGKWNSGDFATRFVEVKCNYGSIGDTFKAIVGANAYFGYQINGQTFNNGQPNGGTSYEYQVGDEVNWELFKTIQIGDPIAIFGSADMTELDLGGLSKYLTSVSFRFGNNKDITNKLETFKISIPEELLIKMSYKGYFDDDKTSANTGIVKTAFEKLKDEYPNINEDYFNDKTYQEELDANESSPDFYRLETNENGEINYSYFVKNTGGTRNYSCTSLALSSLDKLQNLEMAGYAKIAGVDLSKNKFIKKVDARFADSLNSITFADGARIEELKIPNSFGNLVFNNCNKITLPNIHINNEKLSQNGGKNLKTIDIKNCDGLNHDANFKNLILNWISKGEEDGYKSNSDKTLILENINWTNVEVNDIKTLLIFIYGSGEYGGLWINSENKYEEAYGSNDKQGINRANKCKITGTIKMTNHNINKENMRFIDKFRTHSKFIGIDVDLIIPTNVILDIPESIVGGEEITLRSQFYPSLESIKASGGTVEYSFVKEVNSKDDNPYTDYNTGKMYVKIGYEAIRNGSINIGEINTDDYTATLSSSNIICEENTTEMIGVFLTVKNNTIFDIVPLTIKDPTYASSAVMNGDIFINETNKSFEYTLSLFTNKNETPIGEIDINWEIKNFDKYSGLTYISTSAVTENGLSLTITTNDETPVDKDNNPKIDKFNIKANITNKRNGGDDTFSIEKTITIINKNVVMTEETNEVVFDILKEKLDLDKEYLTLEEARSITSIGTWFSGRESEFSFNEFKNFTGLQLEPGAFANSKIKSIILPDQINKIPEKAFLNCNLLNNLEIPDNVTSIGNYAFGGVGFEKIIFKSNAKTTDSKTLYINSDSSLYSIGNDAFEDENGWSVSNTSNKLNTISIPDNLQIPDGNYKFLLSKNLKDVIISNNNNIRLENNLIYGSNGPSLIRAIPKSSLIEKVEVDTNVTRVYDYAFYGCESIKKVKFGNNLQGVGLGVGVFYNSNIENIDLSESEYLNKLYEYTFNNMPELSEVKLPENITTLGHHLFVDCPKLVNLNLPESIKTLEASGPTGSETYTFVNCGFVNLELPDYMGTEQTDTKIPNYIISNCQKLERLKMPKFGKTDRGKVIYNCSNLTELTLPVFTYYSENNECVINNEVLKMDRLDDSYFGNCFNITKYKINESDNNLYYKAEDNGIIYQVGNKNGNTITSRDKKKIIAVPFTITDFNEMVDDEIDSIGKAAFAHTQITGDIIIPNNIINIEDGAFAECKNIKKVIWPNKIVNIPNAVFYGCTNLAEIIIPKQIDNIYQFAFVGCTNLNKIILLSSSAPTLTTGDRTTKLSINNKDYDIYEYHPFGYTSNSLVGLSTKNNNNILYLPYEYNEKTYENEKWNVPLFEADLCNFTKEYFPLSGYITVRIFKNDNEVTDNTTYTFISEEKNLKFSDTDRDYTSTYNFDKNVKGFNINLDNRVFHNEPIYVYEGTGESKKEVGKITPLYGTKEYVVRYQTDESILYGLAKNSENNDENFIISKKEYENLLSRVNQMAELLGKLQK